MFRKYVIITLATIFVVGHTGCTSKKAQDEGADVEASADDESLESAEATENNEDLETASTDDGESMDEGGGDELAPDEQLPSDDGGMVAENAEVGSNDLAETPAEAPPEPAPLDTPPPETLAEGEAPPADMAATENPSDMGSSEPAPEPTPEPAMEEPAAKPVASLQKIKAQPYKHGKILVNAVYLARSGDTVGGISQKVFGSPDREKEICKVNEYNCSRPIKVGDKFYYNSPQRPNDDTVIKTFYEDAGIQPETYTAKQGDNIRKVGKELLGNERSWMELWATNDVESKGDLDEGTTLKYWPASEAAAPVQTVADAGGQAPADAGAAPPSDMGAPPPDAGSTGDMAGNPPPSDMGGDMGAPPPPPPPDAGGDMAANNLPPDAGSADLPPAPDANAAGSVEPPPPPPPPPPPSDSQASNDASVAGAEDPNQQTFMLGVGAVLILAAAALFISIRKKRARRQIDFNTTTQTQIE